MLAFHLFWQLPIYVIACTKARIVKVAVKPGPHHRWIHLPRVKDVENVKAPGHSADTHLWTFGHLFADALLKELKVRLNNEGHQGHQCADGQSNRVFVQMQVIRLGSGYLRWATCSGPVPKTPGCRSVL